MTSPAIPCPLAVRRATALVAPRAAAPATFSVLATACIRPARFPGLERTDPKARLDDYVRALAAIAGESDPRVGSLVVLENSGTDPDAFLRRILEALPAAGASRSIEVISYQPPERPSGVHYGYSEFKMIDDLMDESRLLDSRFVKITGRYRFPGLSRLLDHVPDRLGFFCDSQDLPAFPGRAAQRTINASIFVADRAFFDARVRPLYRQMREELRFTHVENIIFDALIAENEPAGVVTLRLPVSCDPVGIGGNGARLGAGTPKRLLRSMARRMFKRVWL